MPRPTEHITDYPDYSDEAERQRRALIDSLERDEDDVFDRRRDDLYDRSRASNGYNDTHRAGSGGYSDSSKASTPRSPERIEIGGKDAPPNRMMMPVDIVPPQRDLVPLWDGAPIYGTPDTPASPLDCNRWPSSPYCGGNPFDWKPFGISVDAVNDGGSAVNKEGGNIGIQVTPVIMFVKMPPIQIVARNPWCKPEPPRENAQPTVQLPKDFDGEFGTPGKLYRLKFKAKEIAYQNAYYCPPDGGKPTKPIKYVLFPQLNPITELNVTVTGPVRLQILHGRADELIGNTVDYYGQGQCGIVGTNKTTRYNGYDKGIYVSVQHRNGSTIYLYTEGQRIMSEFARKVGTFTKEGQQLNMIWTSGEHDVLEFNLDDIPQDIPRYLPPPPWEPPPPPPEPRQRRDDPEECECMCCNDGNTEALIAMLMQKIAQLESNLGVAIQNNATLIKRDIAPLATSEQAITILNSIGENRVDLSPVLNDTTLIKRDIESLATAEQVNKISNVLQVDKYPISLNQTLGDDGTPALDNDGKQIETEITISGLTDFVEEMGNKRTLKLLNKVANIVQINQYPLKVPELDANGEKVLDKDKKEVEIELSGLTSLVRYLALSNKDSNLLVKIAKIIEIDSYPLKLPDYDEKGLPIVKDGNPVEISVPGLTSLVKRLLLNPKLITATLESLQKLIGTPVEVELFDEDTAREGRQPKKITPPTLFESMALAIKRGEVTNEVIGIDMFPITLKPQFSEDAQVNWDVLSDERNILTQALDLLGTIDPISWIFDFEGSLQGTLDLAGDAWNWLQEYIKMYTDEKKLNNLVELTHFTRQQIVEAVDDNEFPIVVEKEQIGGEQDLAFESPADAIEEVLILLYNMAKTNGYQTDISLKCLAESVHTKAIAAMVQGEVRNIADWCDYPSNAVVRDLSIQMNLPTKELADGKIDLDQAEDLDKFLEPSKIHITFDEWTGKKSFMDMMRDLLNNAASARSQSTRS